MVVVQETGKRKTAVARVTMVKGKGLITVNNEEINKYFSNQYSVLKAIEPIFIADVDKKYDIRVNIFGGGVSSQVDAIRQAIAKCLVTITGKDDLKKTFIAYDRSLIVTDTRFKEMKKPNNSKARAKRQKSYR